MLASSSWKAKNLPKIAPSARAFKPGILVKQTPLSGSKVDVCTSGRVHTSDQINRRKCIPLFREGVIKAVGLRRVPDAIAFKALNLGGDSTPKSPLSSVCHG